jgi:hypothetical protein
MSIENSEVTGVRLEGQDIKYNEVITRSVPYDALLVDIENADREIAMCDENIAVYQEKKIEWVAIRDAKLAIKNQVPEPDPIEEEEIEDGE